MARQEIYEIATKAFPPEFKQAIHWGEGYEKIYPAYSYILSLTRRYLLPKDVAEELLIKLFEVGRYFGMRTFESLTRGWPDRYLSLAMIDGVRILENKEVKPLAEKDHHRFIPYAYLFGFPDDKLRKELDNQIKYLRRNVKLYKVKLRGGKTLVLPEEILRLYKAIYNMMMEEYQMQEPEWNTRKKRIEKVMDGLTIEAFNFLTDRGIAITEENVNQILDFLQDINERARELEERKQKLEEVKHIDIKSVKRKTLINEYLKYKSQLHKQKLKTLKKEVSKDGKRKATKKKKRGKAN